MTLWLSLRLCLLSGVIWILLYVYGDVETH